MVAHDLRLVREFPRVEGIDRRCTQKVVVSDWKITMGFRTLGCLLFVNPAIQSVTRVDRNTIQPGDSRRESTTTRCSVWRRQTGKLGAPPCSRVPRLSGGLLP